MPLDLEDEYITKDGLKKQPRSIPNEPPTYVTGAIHVIKLRRLWSKFADNLYPTTTTSTIPRSTTRQVLAGHLRQELEEWHATIPDPVDHSGSHPLSVFASKAWFQLRSNGEASFVAFDDNVTTQQSAVSDDWIMGLDDLSMPYNSEWFVQELLQGMREFQHPEITFDDLAGFAR